MRKKGKKWFGLLIAIVFLCAFCVPVAAASKLPRLQVKSTACKQQWEKSTA